MDESSPSVPVPNGPDPAASNQIPKPVPPTNPPFQPAQTEPPKTPVEKSEVDNHQGPRSKFNYPPVFWRETQELIGQLETSLKGKLLVYYLANDMIMVPEDVDYFYSHLKGMGSQDNLNLLIYSSGGSGLAALRTANMLYSFTNSLTTLVPSKCASAGTMLALAGSKIVMGPAGFLTAIDTSLVTPINPKGLDNKPERVSIDELRKVVEIMKASGSTNIYETLFQYIHPLVVGGVERSASLSREIVSEILSLHQENQELVKAISTKLDQDFPNHSYPISYVKARQLNLPVERADSQTSSLMWSLIAIYSRIVQPTRTNTGSDKYHQERTPVVIESLGRRTFNASSLDFIRDRANWVREQMDTNWISTTEKDVDGQKKLIFSSIDI